jgi:hypothetical protein
MKHFANLKNSDVTWFYSFIGYLDIRRAEQVLHLIKLLILLDRLYVNEYLLELYLSLTF